MVKGEESANVRHRMMVRTRHPTKNQLSSAKDQVTNLKRFAQYQKLLLFQTRNK